MPFLLGWPLLSKGHPKSKPRVRILCKNQGKQQCSGTEISSRLSSKRTKVIMIKFSYLEALKQPKANDKQQAILQITGQPLKIFATYRQIPLHFEQEGKNLN